MCFDPLVMTERICPGKSESTERAESRLSESNNWEDDPVERSVRPKDPSAKTVSPEKSHCFDGS